MVRSALSSEEKSEFNSDCKNLWIQLNLVGSKSVLIGAYYKPHEFDQHSLDEWSKSLDMVKQTSSTIWLIGDFNLPKVDWRSLAPTPDCKFPTFYRECLEVFNDCLLELTATSPTRGKHILDLCFTSNPTRIDSVSILPGLSDHDIVQVQWDKFASRLEQGIDKFIPTMKAATRDGFPCINQEIRRLMRKSNKLYKRMKQSGRSNDTKKFQEYKHLVRRVKDRAYERYLGDSLGINTTTEQEENSP